MPLPPALANKLAKRGLISVKNPQKPIKKDEYKGFPLCPNKNNKYHICNQWCENNWKGFNTPDPNYLRNIQKLLFKYPLPHNWTEVFDKSVGRYYYWNMENDLVSWLPPKHPNTNPTVSAAKLREQMMTSKHKEEEKSDNEDNENRRSHKRRDTDRDRERDDRHKRDRGRDREERQNYKRHHKDNLDPMDPASYSDIPPGTWSDGLENRSSADNTAPGVLFQQRPYPSPGEVLAGNKEKSRKHS